MEEENNINKSRNLTEKSIENAERGNLLEGSHLYTFLYTLIPLSRVNLWRKSPKKPQKNYRESTRGNLID